MLLDDTARHRRTGIALICVCTLCFSTLDASGKWLVRSLPVFEVVWLRFLLHALIAGILLAPSEGRALWRMHAPHLHALRALMLGVMTWLNFWALQYLQLAETAAIQFSVPILIALISHWVLGEHLDARRWLAIIGGFIGVLLVIRPGAQGFHPAILLSVLNAILYAAFNLLTRRMAARESPAAMQWLSAVGAAVLIAPFALAHWQWPAGPLEWALLCACGLFGALGHHAAATAHRYASAAVLGPFLYQQILYMSVWGWLVFAQVPDRLVVAGAAVVVVSGLYLLWMELRGHKATMVLPPR